MNHSSMNGAFLPANAAREVAAETWDRQNQEHLVRDQIAHQIESSSEEGHCEILVEKELPEKLLKDLEQLGYVVKKAEFLGGWLIRWEVAYAVDSLYKSWPADRRMRGLLPALRVRAITEEAVRAQAIEAQLRNQIQSQIQDAARQGLFRTFVQRSHITYLLRQQLIQVGYRITEGVEGKYNGWWIHWDTSDDQ